MDNKITPSRLSIKTSFLGLIAMLFCSLLIIACGEKEHSRSEAGTDPAAEALAAEALAAEAPAAEAITIKNAHIRAMPPGQKVTAMFLTLDNSSNVDHSLVKVESNVSDAVELHEHKHVDGMMKMGQVSSISIPKNGSVALASGGYHVMMIGLKQDLKLGEKVAVKLIFEDGTSQDVEPEVKKVTPH